jgi:hypothetical protein
MRNGDFAVEVIAHGGGRVRELDSGQVLARPGQVYRLRLRNFGPLYAVVNVDIDGHAVTAGGLVLEPWGMTDLERPIDAAEDGRFTVVAEGDESVFGPDGGRDNGALGLIDARFKRELPRADHRTDMPPTIALPLPSRVASPMAPRWPSRVPAPPEWIPPTNRAAFYDVDDVGVEDAVERAAGTGLTGHSDQRFVPIQLGALEGQATVIQLRLVIGTDEALAEDTPRPLVAHGTPPRPAPRP